MSYVRDVQGHAAAGTSIAAAGVSAMTPVEWVQLVAGIVAILAGLSALAVHIRTLWRGRDQ